MTTDFPLVASHPTDGAKSVAINGVLLSDSPESPSFREEHFPGRMPKASFDEIRDDFFAEVVALSALGGN